MASSEATEATLVGPGLSMRVVIFGIRKRFRSVSHLNCSQVAELSKSQGIVYLDTRSKEEYNVSHIPGAIRVDPDDDDVTGVVNQLSATTPVVCYCSVGYRSSLVAQRLYKHYREHRQTCPPLHNLEGGLFQWANEGRPLAISNTVHPYSSAWGMLLESKLRSQM